MSAGRDTWRLSRLTRSDERVPPHDLGEFTLLAGDLHNHSLNSDGRGDPETAFAQLRAAGLDVAALTDHASIYREHIADLDHSQYPDRGALALARLAPGSFDAAAWKRTAELADAHDVPGEFTALRGFEWTEPWLGHVNVWFSHDYLPVTTPGRLSGLQEWLVADEPDALFGYNHPGREPGRLEDFTVPDGAAGDGLPRRMVALEVFNRTEDFLFAGHAEGLASPIVECLDAGWRPGLIGCSDEHGRSYGLAGKGRTGLWVREHSRDGVREALLARRTFATREVGLRLDAVLDGVHMGGDVAHRGRVRLSVDLGQRRDLAPAGGGRALPDGYPLELQLLCSGQAMTARGLGSEVAVLGRGPAAMGELTELEVEIPDGVPWVLLRVADPARGYGFPAPLGHPAANHGVAYSSPWWLS